MKFDRALLEKTFEIEKGDIILTGKFKNKVAKVKGFDTDENGQPTVKTNKGEKKVYSFRINKLMPKDKQK
jgi:hypothetical protein